MNRVYVITGACGHLGSTIARALNGRGEEVHALALPDESAQALDGTGIEIVRGDVREAASLDRLFDGLEGREVFVIHAAGIISIQSKFDQNILDVNVGGTKNIIDCCRRYGVRRLVYVSSVHAIAEKPAGQTMEEVAEFDPEKVVGLYARTKAEATRLVLRAAAEGMDCVVVHPSGICGPGDYGRGHMTQLVIDFMRGQLTACIKGGYDFVDVRDVAEGIIAATERAQSGECYILSNRFFSVPELLDMLAEVGHRRRIRTVLPLWFAQMTAPLAEMWYRMRRRPPLFTRYSIETLSGNAQYSHRKADEALNYRTRDMCQTLADTLAFLRESGRIPKK